MQLLTRTPFGASFILLCHGLAGVLAAVDCTGSITISNAQDGDDVRKACPTIGGDLVLNWSVVESINLDGVETIRGSLSHPINYDTLDVDNGATELFSISSSTLAEIGGGLELEWFNGLHSVEFPNLESVQEDVLLSNLFNLTHVDLTNLAEVGRFILLTPALETLELAGLQSFVEDGSEWRDKLVLAYASIFKAGHVESIDAITAAPLDPTSPQSTFSLIPQAIPDVRSLTLGWSRYADVHISGDDLDVTLGGPDTKTMEIRDLKIGPGVTGLHRGGDQVENITAQSFTMVATDQETKHLYPTELDLGIFDQLSGIDIYSETLKSLTLPPQVENWTNLSMSIICPGYDFALQDDSGNQIWYWPKNNMNTLWLTGNLNNDFVKPFLDSDITITESLTITDESGELDCAPFKTRHNSTGLLPGNFSCYSSDQNIGSALSASSSSWGFLVAMAVATLVVA